MGCDSNTDTPPTKKQSFAAKVKAFTSRRELRIRPSNQYSSNLERKDLNCQHLYPFRQHIVTQNNHPTRHFSAPARQGNGREPSMLGENITPKVTPPRHLGCLTTKFGDDRLVTGLQLRRP